MGKVMRCTKCGTDNAADARFCNQCATPLNRACPKCTHPNAPDAKFCAQCAAALGLQTVDASDASTLGAEEIRVVVAFLLSAEPSYLFPVMAEFGPECLNLNGAVS
jgi:hypothetical protein